MQLGYTLEMVNINIVVFLNLFHNNIIHIGNTAITEVNNRLLLKEKGKMI
jgi:hypothetical protein